jgi:hypothetical protein
VCLNASVIKSYASANAPFAAMWQGTGFCDRRALPERNLQQFGPPQGIEVAAWSWLNAIDSFKRQRSKDLCQRYF